MNIPAENNNRAYESAMPSGTDRQPSNSPTQGGQATPGAGTADDAAPPELNSKMVGGGEELRDHDFPIPNQASEASSFVRMEDTGKPEIHEQRGGGTQGEMPGDKQKVGVNGTIMDQDLVEPDFAQQTN